MGMYDIINEKIECVRCKKTNMMEIQIKELWNIGTIYKKGDFLSNKDHFLHIETGTIRGIGNCSECDKSHVVSFEIRNRRLGNVCNVVGDW